MAQIQWNIWLDWWLSTFWIVALLVVDNLLYSFPSEMLIENMLIFWRHVITQESKLRLCYCPRILVTCLLIFLYGRRKRKAIRHASNHSHINHFVGFSTFTFDYSTTYVLIILAEIKKYIIPYFKISTRNLVPRLKKVINLPTLYYISRRISEPCKFSHRYTNGFSAFSIAYWSSLRTDVICSNLWYFGRLVKQQ